MENIQEKLDEKQHNTPAENVYESILEAILSGHLAPGSVISEVKLA